MATRTLVQTVQRLIRGLGDNAPSTGVGNPSQTVRLAVDAVNDALIDIYGRARWDWRLKNHKLPLVQNIMVYQLPDDFGEPHLGRIPILDGARHIEYVEYAKLVDAHPEWIPYWVNGPSGATGPTLDTPFLTASTQWQLDNAGVTELYTTWNNTLFLWPPPSAEFCQEKSFNEFSPDARLIIPYYRTAPELVADTDPLPLPQQMWPALTYLAQAYLKQALSYDDFAADEGRAERMIAKLVQRKTKRIPKTLRFKVSAV